MEVYLIEQYCGDGYEGSHHIVCAFANKDRADKYVLKYNKLLDKLKYFYQPRHEDGEVKHSDSWDELDLDRLSKYHNIQDLWESQVLLLNVIV